MKKIIRLTESDLKNIIKETLETMLKKPGGDLEYLINIPHLFLLIHFQNTKS